MNLSHTFTNITAAGFDLEYLFKPHNSKIVDCFFFFLLFYSFTLQIIYISVNELGIREYRNEKSLCLQ